MTATVGRRPAKDVRKVKPGQLVARRFRLKRRLGKGGSAIVFEARDLVAGRQVALKMPKGLIGGGDLLDEAAVAARVEHRNSIDVYAAGLDRSGRGFVAMELIAGPSLAAVMAAVGPMSERSTATLALDICAAIQELHDAGMVHCDIKPANLMMRRTDRSLVLIDFGLATPLGQPIDGDGISGTPSYISPEQALGMPVDARTDVYSLGCLMFAMLEGHTPYQANSAAEALYKHIGAPVPEVDSPRVSAKLRELVESMMQKDPSERPPSVRSVAAVLKSILTTPAAH